MYCPQCGREVPAGGKFCPGCGREVEQGSRLALGNSTPPLQDRGLLVGFSSRIIDPAFQKYINDSGRWSYVFAFILAGAAAIGFPVYGRLSGTLDLPASLFYGLGLGALFVIIAFFQNWRRNRDTTWDGIVIEKKSQVKQGYNRNTQRSYVYTEYVLAVEREDGKIVRHVFRDNRVLYDYLAEGDRVRHHKGLNFYEKYDKSRDAKILCVACLSMNDIRDDRCFRCDCPLLK